MQQTRTREEQRQLVEARYLVVDDTAKAHAVEFNRRVRPHQDAHNKRSAEITRSRRSIDTKFRMLYALADDIGKHADGLAACKRGCSHCCHIAVGMLQGEAEVLGRAIGVKPAKVQHRSQFAGFDFGYHNPCTFLRNGECSIYENRPLACRTHYNFDADPLLCELYPPDTANVPYWNSMPLQMLAMQICAQAGKITMQDIRAFFPAKPKSF
jgi:Fe-S-cluster containining protein